MQTSRSHATSCTIAAIALAIGATCAANTSSTPRKAMEPARPADPHKVLSNEACIKCHAPSVEVWRRTPHAKTFDELHRRPEAKLIAKKLQLTSIKHDNRCVACHYTQQHTAAGDLHVIAGVSCESCHGAAKDWNDLHHDYGGEGLTRKDESPEHRTQRIAASIAAGMRNPVNVYLVAQSCLRCHTTADEQLVNVGGHSAGSLDFEFVSWSQGTIRHNFSLSGGQTNQVRSPEKLRLMFVAGMIAELEAALRGTAVATQKATYGVTVAKRAARAAARLKSVSQKVESPTIDQILEVFRGISLKLNNEQQLVTAANEIAALGYQFAEQPSSEDLSPLDTFIPKPDRYK
ncbi:MAG: cytochrome c family protein [Rubripirellula sp.]|nr:cytochrome c family protein [Rubripirellula sp.]